MGIEAIESEGPYEAHQEVQDTISDHIVLLNVQ